MRDLCPGLFPGRAGCAVFLHIVRTDAEPIVSYLGYIASTVPVSSYRRPRQSGRKKTYDWQRGRTVRGQGTRVAKTVPSLVPITRERGNKN
jgi:hypothetical protein